MLLDMLIAVGGYRAVSMGINSAGVQLDANMADFDFQRRCGSGAFDLTCAL